MISTWYFRHRSPPPSGSGGAVGPGGRAGARDAIGVRGESESGRGPVAVRGRRASTNERAPHERASERASA
eukprot:scaffold446_cov336-Prasinococcus_capsulatus_cf.AAC.3